MNGISALALVCTAFISAILSMIRYHKTKNKIHFSGTIFYFAIAIGWSGITLSFLSVLLYGDNVSGLKQIVPYFSYSTIPIGCIAILAYAWNLLLPKKHKKKVLIVSAILGIFYYISLFAAFDKVVICHAVPRGEIYDDWLSYQGIPYYIVWIYIISSTIAITIGIIKYLKFLTDHAGKRVIWFIISAPIFALGIMLDTVIITDVAYVGFLFIPRFLMIPGCYMIHHGVKREEEEKLLDYEELVSKRRDVTAKEVTFYRERKICLVCKGKVGGFNIFICTKCDALYCEKCARALTDLENSCWACNEAIDKSKPVRQIKSEEEAIELKEVHKMPKKKIKKK